MSAVYPEPQAAQAVSEPAVSSELTLVGTSFQPHATTALTAADGDWEDLPFRLDQEMANFWGDADSYLDLLPHFEKYGFGGATLSVAKIKGDTRKPLLFDGHKTLLCWKACKAKGLTWPLPSIHTCERDCEEDIWLEMLRRQLLRRNLSAAEKALAVIKLVQATTGSKVTVLKNGRPTKADAATLTSAKKAAAILNVPEYPVTIVTRAQKHPEIYDRLFDPDPEKRLSLRQAENKLKAIKRDADRKLRSEITKKRAEVIAAMPKVNAPDVVGPGGIFTGDFAQMMAKIAPASVSLILCSPPYPIQSVEYDLYRYKGYSEYLDTIVRPLFFEASRILRPGGRIVVNFDSGRGETDDTHDGPKWPRLPVVKDFSKFAEDTYGLMLIDHKSWYKQNAAGQLSAVGSMNSCRSPRGNYNNEFIFVWAKDLDYLEEDGYASDVGDEYHKFSMSDWFIQPAPRLKPDHPDFHPCPFAEELCYRAIKLWCYPNDVVVDPFNGSGTLTFVARALGRQFIGIDNSPLYNASAQRRLATLDGLTAEEMQAKIKRFCPRPGARTDGR